MVAYFHTPEFLHLSVFMPLSHVQLLSYVYGGITSAGITGFNKNLRPWKLWLNIKLKPEGKKGKWKVEVKIMIVKITLLIAESNCSVQRQSTKLANKSNCIQGCP